MKCDASERFEARGKVVGGDEFNEMGLELERRPQLGQQVFARGLPDSGSTAAGTIGGDITALLRACLLALRVPEQQEAAADLTHRRAAVASTLVAGLELARDGEITLQQEHPWLPIRVEQPSDQAAAGAA